MSIKPHQRLIVALDFPSIDEAREMALLLSGRVGVFKIGLELVCAGGLELVRELAERGEKVFLDLKLLDIGHTVMKAVQAAARSGASFLTIHAIDHKTIRAAIEGRGESSLKLLGVTVMTNLDRHDLDQQGIDPAFSPASLALKRAAMACRLGFDGVVSSAHEAAAIRRETGDEHLIITPGIRPAGSARGDQSRIMTPRRALAAGADYLVIGRPITQADDPLAVVEKIIDEMEA